MVKAAAFPSVVDIGMTIAGKYVLTRKLGEGGMGAVYEAEHKVIGRRFAVKLLRPELASQSDMLARFRREAQAAGSLESNHVVAVVDFGVEGGLPYMVMEFLKGRDLRALMNRGEPLTTERAVDFAVQTCRGLAEAHANDIVHRDLKPENIFVTSVNGIEWVKILDFGVAKLRSKVASGLNTKPGAILGTLYYMPPEQVRGDQTIDHRADIYALGAILYECLSGRLPHPGAEAQTILYHIMHQPIAWLGSLREDLPEGLVAVVHKSLSFDPSDRYGTAEEFGSALLPFGGRALTSFDVSEPLLAEGVSTGRRNREEVTERILPPFDSDPGEPILSSDATLPDIRHSSIKPMASSVGGARSNWLFRSKAALVGTLALICGAVASVALVFRGSGEQPAKIGVVEPLVPDTGSAIRARTFEVSVTVEPRFATLALDGKRVGVGGFRATLPADGREHTLQVAADGYVAQTIAFVNRMPVERVELVKLSLPVASAAPDPASARGPRKVNSPVRAVPPVKVVPPVKSSAPSNEEVPKNPYVERAPPTRNRAPILD